MTASMLRHVIHIMNLEDGDFSGYGVQVNALEFLNLGDCDRASSLSLEYGAGGLHILSYKRHHLFTLAGVRHIR